MQAAPVHHATQVSHPEFVQFMGAVASDEFVVEKQLAGADMFFVYNAKNHEVSSIGVYSGLCCIIPHTPNHRLPLGSFVSTHPVEEYSVFLDEMESKRIDESLPGFAVTYGRHWLLGNMVGISTIRGCYIVRERP